MVAAEEREQQQEEARRLQQQKAAVRTAAAHAAGGQDDDDDMLEFQRYHEALFGSGGSVRAVLQTGKGASLETLRATNWTEARAAFGIEDGSATQTYSALQQLSSDGRMVSTAVAHGRLGAPPGDLLASMGLDAAHSGVLHHDALAAAYAAAALGHPLSGAAEQLLASYALRLNQQDSEALAAKALLDARRKAEAAGILPPSAVSAPAAGVPAASSPRRPMDSAAEDERAAMVAAEAAVAVVQSAASRVREEDIAAAKAAAKVAGQAAVAKAAASPPESPVASEDAAEMFASLRKISALERRYLEWRARQRGGESNAPSPDFSGASTVKEHLSSPPKLPDTIEHAAESKAVEALAVPFMSSGIIAPPSLSTLNGGLAASAASIASRQQTAAAKEAGSFALQTGTSLGSTATTSLAPRAAVAAENGAPVNVVVPFRKTSSPNASKQKSLSASGSMNTPVPGTSIDIIEEIAAATLLAREAAGAANVAAYYGPDPNAAASAAEARAANTAVAIDASLAAVEDTVTTGGLIRFCTETETLLHDDSTISSAAPSSSAAVASPKPAIVNARHTPMKVSHVLSSPVVNNSPKPLSETPSGFTNVLIRSIVTVNRSPRGAFAESANTDESVPESGDTGVDIGEDGVREGVDSSQPQPRDHSKTKTGMSSPSKSIPVVARFGAFSLTGREAERRNASSNNVVGSGPSDISLTAEAVRQQAMQVALEVKQATVTATAMASAALSSAVAAEEEGSAAAATALSGPPPIFPPERPVRSPRSHAYVQANGCGEIESPSKVMGKQPPRAVAERSEFVLPPNLSHTAVSVPAAALAAPPTVPAPVSPTKESAPRIPAPAPPPQTPSANAQKPSRHVKGPAFAAKAAPAALSVQVISEPFTNSVTFASSTRSASETPLDSYTALDSGVVTQGALSRGSPNGFGVTFHADLPDRPQRSRMLTRAVDPTSSAALADASAAYYAQAIASPGQLGVGFNASFVAGAGTSSFAGAIGTATTRLAGRLSAASPGRTLPDVFPAGSSLAGAIAVTTSVLRASTGAGLATGPAGVGLGGGGFRGSGMGSPRPTPPAALMSATLAGSLDTVPTGVASASSLPAFSSRPSNASSGAAAPAVTMRAGLAGILSPFSSTYVTPGRSSLGPVAQAGASPSTEEAAASTSN
jgi:hypothetical protein